MQSSPVSASMRQKLLEKLNRLSEQAAPRSPVSSSDQLGSDPGIVREGSSIKEQSPQPEQASLPSDAGDNVVEERNREVLPVEKLASEVQDSSCSHGETSEKLSDALQPEVLQKQTGPTVEKQKRQRRKPKSKNVQEPHARTGDAPQKHKEEHTPEWRATSHLNKNQKGRQAKAPSNLDKLLRLERQLKLALWGLNQKHTQREVTESDFAFLDDSPIDDFHQRIEEPAKTFGYELDDFQKRAILHVEQHNSVFVAAHTSAGKTAIAEYAIALAALGGSKVFYTSPIKTLSNQKYRDFRLKFDDVGLVTGDVSINEDAQCVIMTTEILRSMLYRGADAIRDVTYVVFDEVQFLNDEERGVVWEETIIMLPDHVRMIMLSATVPNALEFASWVGKTKEEQVAVVSTDKRPVPLEHALLHPGESADKLTASLLLTPRGQFESPNFRKATAAMKSKKPSTKARKKETTKKGKKPKKEDGSQDKTIQKSTAGASSIDDTAGVVLSAADPSVGSDPAIKSSNGDDLDEVTSSKVEEEDDASKSESSSNRDVIASSSIAPKGRNQNKGQNHRLLKEAKSGEGKGPGRGPNSRRSPWLPLIRFLHDEKLTPSVVFCFSKKGCEKAVESLEGSDLLPDAKDKSRVHILFQSAIVRLREEDRNLPQVKRVYENLRRGISAHHAGLLPIVKEITEILFSQGLVKVLVATETFAMGVNMPARAVVFSGIRKNDGKRFRSLEAGEYTQMSGRAGRRGMDTVGNVFLFFPPGERFPHHDELKKIMTGKPITLKSAFRLTYNMILNILRVDELRVEEVMKRSFSEATEDVNQERIEKVLSLIGDDLVSADDQERAASSPTASSRNMANYAGKMAELKRQGAALSNRELGPVFSAGLSPGRLVLVETEHGLLSLSVILSNFPVKRGGDRASRSKGETTFIARETKVWVASAQCIVGNLRKLCLKSILFLPESVDRQALNARRGRGACVVTNSGLVVALNQIEASRIVYIFSESFDLTSDEEAQQAAATRQYYESGYKRLPHKCLNSNAYYLADVVKTWKKRMDESRMMLAQVMPDHWSPSTDKKNSNRARRSYGTESLLSKRFRNRAKLCREIVVSDTHYDSLISESCSPGLLCRIKEEIIREGVLSTSSELRRLQRTKSQPALLPDYQNRVKVLQKLDYIGADGLIVQLKGRCGCEVTTANSLVLTEIVCENVLYGLTPAEVGSLLSSLVCRKKNVSGMNDKDKEKYSEGYCAAKAKMRAVVENIGKVQKECGVELDFEMASSDDDYEGSICRWDLAETVFQWARGEPFCNIIDLTTQQEGDIVVCVKRLSELLKDAQSVAKGVGNMELVKILEDSVSAIRRDVIFNGSLYYD